MAGEVEPKGAQEQEHPDGEDGPVLDRAGWGVAEADLHAFERVLSHLENQRKLPGDHSGKTKELRANAVLSKERVNDLYHAFASAYLDGMSEPALQESFRQLADLFETLLDYSSKWSGAVGGVGWGIGENRRSFVPLAGTIPPDDPGLKAYSRLDSGRVKSWLPEGPQAFEGLGPFGAIEGDWPGGAPAHSIALPVTSGDRQWAGVILLLIKSGTDQAVQKRLQRLLEMAAPAVGNAMQLLSMRELRLFRNARSTFRMPILSFRRKCSPLARACVVRLP